jgi:hypothetical protein
MRVRTPEEVTRYPSLVGRPHQSMISGLNPIIQEYANNRNNAQKMLAKTMKILTLMNIDTISNYITEWNYGSKSQPTSHTIYHRQWRNSILGIHLNYTPSDPYYLSLICTLQQ